MVGRIHVFQNAWPTLRYIYICFFPCLVDVKFVSCSRSVILCVCRLYIDVFLYFLYVRFVDGKKRIQLTAWRRVAIWLIWAANDNDKYLTKLWLLNASFERYILLSFMSSSFCVLNDKYGWIISVSRKDICGNRKVEAFLSFRAE